MNTILAAANLTRYSRAIQVDGCTEYTKVSEILSLTFDKDHICLEARSAFGLFVIDAIDQTAQVDIKGYFSNGTQFATVSSNHKPFAASCADGETCYYSLRPTALDDGSNNRGLVIIGGISVSTDNGKFVHGLYVAGRWEVYMILNDNFETTFSSYGVVKDGTVTKGGATELYTFNMFKQQMLTLKPNEESTIVEINNHYEKPGYTYSTNIALLSRCYVYPQEYIQLLSGERVEDGVYSGSASVNLRSFGDNPDFAIFQGTITNIPQKSFIVEPYKIYSASTQETQPTDFVGISTGPTGNGISTGPTGNGISTGAIIGIVVAVVVVIAIAIGVTVYILIRRKGSETSTESQNI